MQRYIHKKAVLLAALLFAVLFGTAGILYYVNNAGAEDNSTEAVSLKSIDYENMEITIDTGKNPVVYYSTNKSKWYEAEGVPQTETTNTNENETTTIRTMTYDISWISATSTTTLYFRGNKTKTTLAVKIPGYNKNFKVTFDKTSGQFEFSNTEGAKVIRCRKTTDYNWRYIDVERSTQSGGTGASYDSPQSLEAFEKEVEDLRVKGTKLIFQIAPVKWTDTSNAGSPASKEVKVTIAAKRTAPTIKVNIKKLTVNTTVKMEWTATNPFTTTASWVNCAKTMSLSQVAQDAVDGKEDVTVYFRTIATTSNCESKVAILTIPKREAAPASPVAVVCSAGKTEGKGKAVVSFSNVPDEGLEYAIVKNGVLTDEAKVTWKKVKKAKDVKFSQKSLPANSIIYVRTAGVSANVSKNISLKLPSQYTSVTVGDYPAPSSSTTTGSSSTAANTLKAQFK